MAAVYNSAYSACTFLLSATLYHVCRSSRACRCAVRAARSILQMPICHAFTDPHRVSPRSFICLKRGPSLLQKRLPDPISSTNQNHTCPIGLMSGNGGNFDNLIDKPLPMHYCNDSHVVKDNSHHNWKSNLLSMRTVSLTAMVDPEKSKTLENTLYQNSYLDFSGSTKALCMRGMSKR